LRRVSLALFPVFVMALTLVPNVFASTTYTPYSWSVSCNSNGQGQATASWYWYAGGATGTFLTGGTENCNGTASANGNCPSQGICSLGRPSNADTLIITINANCGYSYSQSAVKSVTPAAPVSATVSVTIKHGSCNGTYAKGSESATLTINA
jgi:hypothetical protein